MYNEIKEFVIETIQSGLEDQSVLIDENTGLMDDIRASSFDLMMWLSEIEDKYDVAIEDRDLRKIFTVKDIVDYIYAHKSEA